VNVLPQAQMEAVEAAAWYEQKRAQLGDEFLDEVARALARIEQRPRSFPRWKSYLGVREIRSCRLERFSYAVIFACEADEPLVIAIGHARRHPLFWLSRIR
jgi:ParE-like toxin of type II ParDE toxin-antitoxin system